MTVSQTDIKRLYNYSGNQCAFPGCTETLANKHESMSEYEPTITSEIAHIVARSLDGPRGNYPLSMDLRDNYDNLILLCPKHHKIIDDNEQKYTVKLLRDWKFKHEKLMTNATRQAVERRKNTIGREDYLGVYIAYEDAQWSLARLIYEYIKDAGFEPFILPVWRFSQDTALRNIKSRPHFITLLTKETIRAIEDPNTKIYTELSFAIRHRRNVINVVYEDVTDLGFLHSLPSEISSLQKFPSVRLIQDYLKDGIRELCSSYFVRLDAIDIAEVDQTELEEISQEVENWDLFDEDIDLSASDYRTRATIKHHLGDLSGAIEDIDEAIEKDGHNFDNFIDRGIIRQQLRLFSDAHLDYEKALELNPHSSRALNNWASLFLQQGNYQKALEYFAKSISINPSNIHALLNRSVAWIQVGNYEAAIHDTTQAIRLADHFVPAYVNRANAYKELDQFERAIADYQTALEIFPNDPIVYNGLGMVFKKMRDAERGFNAFKKAVELSDGNPVFTLNQASMRVAKRDWEGVINDAEQLIGTDHEEDAIGLKALAYFQLNRLDDALQYANAHIATKTEDPMTFGVKGLILREKGLDEQAIEAFRDAVSLDENYFDGWHELGITLGRRGIHQESIECYTKAIEIHPNNYLPYFNRGRQYAEAGDFEKSVEDYSRAAELNPNDADIFIDRGVVLFQNLGDLDGGLNDQNRALEMNPRDPNPYVNRGLIRMVQGEYDLALADFIQAINLDPDNFTGHMNLALLYAKQGRYKDALKSLNKAASLNPTNSLVLTNRCHIHMEMGNFELAMRDCLEAIRLAPLHSDNYIKRGVIYYEMVNFDEAAKDFEYASEINPQNVTAYFNLAELYATQGDYQQAVDAITKAIKIEKRSPQLYLRRAVYFEHLLKTNRAIVDLKQFLRLDLSEFPEPLVDEARTWLAQLKAKSKD